MLDIDAQVAEKVMELPPDKWEPPCPKYHRTDDAEYDSLYGWSGWCYTCDMGINAVAKEPPHYSTDIVAAWMVVEKMSEQDLRLSLDMFGGDPWWSEFADEGYTRGAQATSTTAPMAICLAALKAVSE